MNKSICILMLAISITGNLYAQPNTTRTDKTFELPDDYVWYRFFIDLGKGNTMQIELRSLQDLGRFSNMDSVISDFLATIKPLNDSLGDELLSRRIDFTTDTSGRKELRIRQHKPEGSSYLLQPGEVAALKLEQDTVYILGTVSYTANHTLPRERHTATRRYRIGFFLNDLSDMAAYADGSLNRKIEVLQHTSRSEWNTTTVRGTARLKSDQSIKARLPVGAVAGGNYLTFRFSVDVQNYKNYFAPSFSLGGGVIISNSNFKRDIVLSWDPHFFFGRNNLGQLKTFRNDFVTLTWGQGFVVNHDPKLASNLLFIMSLGYLVNRQGSYIDKNTFRLGAGRLSLFSGKTKIEPALYFNRFFKGVTPALRWIQSF